MMRISVVIATLLVAAPAVLAQTTTTPPTTSPNAALGGMKFFSRQAGQIRASKLIGLNVKNLSNEIIGEINELILDKDGKVVAAVIGVGGFLGMGQREVALDYKALIIKDAPNAITHAGAATVIVDVTKDGLKAAPEWTWLR